MWFFNCERSQGLKLPKTAVFSVVVQLWEEPRAKTAKNRGFWLKTTVFSAVFKLWEEPRSKTTKNCMVFGQKNHGFQCSFQLWEEPRSETAKNHGFLAENCSFQCWFLNVGGPKAKNCSFWPKTAVFSQKPRFSVWFSNVGGAKAKNRSFRPKTVVFSAVFKCGRSQSQKLHGFQPKTTVFSRKIRKNRIISFWPLIK